VGPAAAALVPVDDGEVLLQRARRTAARPGWRPAAGASTWCECSIANGRACREPPGAGPRIRPRRGGRRQPSFDGRGARLSADALSARSAGSVRVDALERLGE